MTALESAYEALRERGLKAITAGDHEAAHGHFEAALEMARQIARPTLVDRASCNLAAVEIELRRGDGKVPQLRQILMRNGNPRGGDPANCFLAAYNIARHYELSKDYRKGLFYAQVARDRAQAIGNTEWRASSFNQIGDLLLARSYSRRATAAYSSALELLAPGPSLRRGQILDNLGYCLILEGDTRTGFRHLYESVRLLRRLGARTALVSVHLDLCFALLENDRPRLARGHGQRALALAEDLGLDESIKNALYLLGEAHTMNGDRGAGRDCFERLEQFYPDAQFCDLLAAVDVRRIINLKA
ncbi:MAG: hypothetical protein AAF604_01300 [Acidobacteriota bacterium]